MGVGVEGLMASSVCVCGWVGVGVGVSVGVGERWRV